MGKNFLVFLLHLNTLDLNNLFVPESLNPTTKLLPIAITNQRVKFIIMRSFKAYLLEQSVPDNISSEDNVASILTNSLAYFVVLCCILFIYPVEMHCG